ncbi:SusD/RagB family nutrient-binding outer membrane lipoprotein [Prevotella sp.]|uniref:SusD/RagB family nutrient-binding outer membrane lipoprotein n=1 Tax=Prevotella sp. TaxID=59823 RepID=UPI002F956000
MKNIKIPTIALLACGLLMTTACTDNFDQTNTNPNKITVAGGKLSASSMFEPLLYGGANALTYYSYYWNNELAQYFALTGNSLGRVYKYDIGDANWTSVWNTYARYATNSVEMHRLATIQNNKALEAVALTMKVLYTNGLTDVFGDIPYGEAFKATEGIKTPIFDSQEDVYKQMFADLEAANKIYAGKPTVNEAEKALDGMYKLDMEKWRKFNNSLYLRLLCRVSGRPQTTVDGSTTVTEKIKQIVTEPESYPIIASNDDNATVVFSGVAPYYSEFDPGEYTQSDLEVYRTTPNLIGLMVLKQPSNEKVDMNVDPRLPIIAKMAKGRAYWKGTGMNQNKGDFGGGDYLNYTSFVRYTADEWLMDYAEVEFILAEAAMKGWISGGEETAKTHYLNAVKASLKKWSAFGAATNPDNTITDEAIEDFLVSPLASWDDAANKLKLIGQQRYLAAFMIGMEGWSEYRRTGYPELKIDESWMNDGVLPTRFAYPNTTIATNHDNAEAALKRMGGANDMKTPVWWSKSAIESGK